MMAMRPLLFGLLLAAVATACSDPSRDSPDARSVPPPSTATTAEAPDVSALRPETAASREETEWDIREAVFRYQFERNASAQQQNADVYFLSLGGETDPPAAFVERFSRHKPQVEGVSHRTDTGTYLVFTIEDVRWVSDDHVEVGGGYYEGPLSASGNTYRVERRDGAWFVTGDTMNLIS